MGNADEVGGPTDGREDDAFGGRFEFDGTGAAEVEGENGDGMALIEGTAAEIMGAPENEAVMFVAIDAAGTGCVICADAIGKRKPISYVRVTYPC